MREINWIVTPHDCVGLDATGRVCALARPLVVLSDHPKKRELKTNPRPPRSEEVERQIEEYRFRKTGRGGKK